MRSLIRNTALYVVDEPVNPDLGITRFASEWRRRFDSEPSFLFTNVVDYPGSRVVMNLFHRRLVLDALGLPHARFASSAADRIAAAPARVTHAPSLATCRLRGVLELPVLRHQPRDAGRYLTSFVGCMADPDSRARNLGFYRVLVRGDRQGVIFMDPRTDAHRICRRTWSGGVAGVPITLYAGGPVSTCFAAASAIPIADDSYELAARLSDGEVVLDTGAYPSAPSDAEIVIHGRVLDRLADEAPFGEFKGYYCKPTRSPVLEIDDVWTRPDAYYPALFCGKESGLELMSLPNEILMCDQLRRAGFPVSDVRYPLAAFGEFATLIEVPDEFASGALEAALRFDRRTKVIVVAPRIGALPHDLSIFDFEAFSIPYIKRAEAHGSRIGVVMRSGVEVDRVEL